MTGLMQANRENRRDSRCDDARVARSTHSNARSRQLRLEPAVLSKTFNGRAINWMTSSRINTSGPETDQGVQVQARREQDEQSGNQQHAEVFLEVQDVPHVHAFHVGQPHAHQRHGQQAGFMHHLVGTDEDRQHRCQRGQVMQVFRQPLTPDHRPEQPATDDTKHGCRRGSPRRR